MQVRVHVCECVWALVHVRVNTRRLRACASWSEPACVGRLALVSVHTGMVCGCTSARVPPVCVQGLHLRVASVSPVSIFLRRASPAAPHGMQGVRGSWRSGDVGTVACAPGSITHLSLGPPSLLLPCPMGQRVPRLRPAIRGDVPVEQVSSRQQPWGWPRGAGEGWAFWSHFPRTQQACGSHLLAPGGLI